MFSMLYFEIEDLVDGEHQEMRLKSGVDDLMEMRELEELDDGRDVFTGERLGEEEGAVEEDVLGVLVGVNLL